MNEKKANVLFLRRVQYFKWKNKTDIAMIYVDFEARSPKEGIDMNLFLRLYIM